MGGSRVKPPPASAQAQGAPFPTVVHLTFRVYVSIFADTCGGEYMRRILEAPLPPVGACVLRRGRVGKHGYAEVEVSGGRRHRAHRVAFEKAWGPIPAGLYVCHSCDSRACVNPDHLWLGTHAENQADMVRKGRSTAGERNPAAKLTADAVLAIRSDGRLLRELAAEYGVTMGMISRIRRGLKWSSV